MDALGDLGGHDDLWIALALSLALGLALVLVGARRPEVGMVLAVGLVAQRSAVGSVVIMAVALVAAFAEKVHSERAAAVMLSGLAVGAAYLCTPDTERSVILLGALVSTAALVLALGLSWSGPAAATSVLLAWIAVTDGEPRASAAIATVAIAVVHLLLQRLDLRSPVRGLAIVALGGGAFLLLSRVIGTGEGTARPLVLSGAVVALTLVLLVVASVRSGRERAEELRPALADDPE